jgi:hypothetical protein
MLETFNTWLAAWGEERGFGPVRLDAEGFAALEDDAGLTIGLHFSPERGVLKTVADLGAPPERENIADFHEWLLINNFGASVEQEGVLARVGETGHILFVLEWPLGEDASVELLNVFLQQASLLGNQWRDRIAASAGDEDGHADVHVPASIPEHYLAV